jgi:hypothetical protein
MGKLEAKPKISFHTELLEVKRFKVMQSDGL